MPHRAVHTHDTWSLLNAVVASDALQVLAAYQNCKSSLNLCQPELTVGQDLLKRFAPRVFAYQRSQLDRLWDHSALLPPFERSAFSTAEFAFGNVALRATPQPYDVIHGLRAITVLGTSTTCICVVPSDNLAIRCPPGTTILIAGCVKGYYFSTVGEGEKRYLFQQFFHAGVQRWIDRGFRSDADFDQKATAEESESVEAKLAKRVPFTMKLLSRLHEIS
ncbi:hypothetical protein C8R47DRAFT_994720 [Mycena vitilis]|nr:hypothetical protein C8R47DRAFT_994720 [Mycena vitilis]